MREIKTNIVVARRSIECFEHRGREVNCIYKKAEADSGGRDNEGRHTNRAIIVATTVLVMMECYCENGEQEKKQADKRQPAG